ncbi:hypothetical protein [Solicola sp. PLA-1-18]|uniref:hypothetical protein n=1 Tax=Solicola sp. PLA-1-18 TaxID=3380532 RepID=UPI003B785A70
MAKNRPAPSNRSTSQPPSRLPSTRERRPALAGLAVLLIVGGAAASGWLALRAGDRVEFLQVRSEVAQGQQIQADDLETVRLPRGFDDGVSADQRDQVEKYFATTRLVPGTVLNSGMLAEDGGLPEGTVQATVSVSPAVARNLTAGTSVAMTVESGAGADAEPQIVLGEVVSVPEGDDSGGIGGADSDVPVQVSIGGRCFKTLSSGLANDGVQVALVGDASDAGLGTACARS